MSALKAEFSPASNRRGIQRALWEGFDVWEDSICGKLSLADELGVTRQGAESGLCRLCAIPAKS